MDVLINTAISGVVGAVVATGIAIYFQVKLQKRKLVLSIIETYLESSSLRIHAKWVFESCTIGDCKCIYPDNSATNDEKQRANENFNKLIELGDWYEIVATLYRTRSLDTYLFDVTGLRSQVLKFLTCISNIEHERAREFQEFWPQLFEMQ